jgi:4-diphosphocytidyl-2-C-methyl-D-erythritol kinase
VNAGRVRIQAPAKINLVLRVLGRRPDGYHDIWSLMQTVELYDELEVAVQPDPSAGIELRCDDPALPVDHTNLVYRAAALVMEQARCRAGLAIKLYKRIPTGAGLGGGSSDAAATILALNQLLGLGWSRAVMGEVGQALGSDVPFFFSAPTAVAAGRGESVQQMSLAESRWVVLVNPGFPIETRWAYRELAASRQEAPVLSQSVSQLAEESILRWDRIFEGAVNDFERPVFVALAVLRVI